MSPMPWRRQRTSSTRTPGPRLGHRPAPRVIGRELSGVPLDFVRPREAERHQPCRQPHQPEALTPTSLGSARRLAASGLEPRSRLHRNFITEPSRGSEQSRDQGSSQPHFPTFHTGAPPIAPADIDDAVITAFITEILSNRSIASPMIFIADGGDLERDGPRTAPSSACVQSPCLPFRSLPADRLSLLPGSFRKDMEIISPGPPVPDPFPDARSRPLAPATARLRRDQITRPLRPWWRAVCRATQHHRARRSRRDKQLQKDRRSTVSNRRMARRTASIGAWRVPRPDCPGVGQDRCRNLERAEAPGQQALPAPPPI